MFDTTGMVTIAFASVSFEIALLIASLYRCIDYKYVTLTTHRDKMTNVPVCECRVFVRQHESSLFLLCWQKMKFHAY